MVIVAEKFGHVIGVDTHARTHTLTWIDTRTGLIDGPETFPTSRAGLERELPSKCVDGSRVGAHEKGAPS